MVWAYLQPPLFLERRNRLTHPFAIYRSTESDPWLVLQGLTHQKQRHLPQIGILSERSLRSIGHFLNCPPAPCADVKCTAPDSPLPRRCLPTRHATAPPCRLAGWGFELRRRGRRKSWASKRRVNLH